ncbi:hypothetical protein [Kriegella aquimaris]|uniref:Uncharacterized protein n=1 Tax=Kriegella aquimaris TaxID=192904 RepID=A0A1G9SQS2_9FLAO|nr:hypothetical protein [Kriegella aquimaris]SDM37799.1 hypothetical protein SAMN04488514_10863 [Kriegella aquimaris]
MENSNLKRRILSEFESLVAVSCPKQKVPQKYKNLHVAILKNHYNAADVAIDYHRGRVEMDVILDDKDYDPKKVNLCVPTLHVNLLFKNLFDFLKTCIDKDSKSLAFYSNLLHSYSGEGKDASLRLA